MQDTCDGKGRVLDVSIVHSGSTLDYLAFMASILHLKLERKVFFDPGLVSYGDNARAFNEYGNSILK